MPVEIVEPLPLDAFFRPEHWPSGTGALMTTRVGGVSLAPFDSLNLKAQTADPLDQIAVAENRRRFATTLGATPVFLDQVHGTRVVRLTAADASPDAAMERADASITTVPGIACTVMVADCLPVLFATRDGRAVGAAHAGWRGLAGGVLEATVDAIRAAAPVPAADIVAWLGASIGPQEFEVGADVLAAFHDAESRHFVPAPARDGVPKWRADLPALAEGRLRRLGLTEVSGCGQCT
ncbi:MAG: peptidoglycan editing factor PgeF, partial [Caulobacter sp.]|nr:peptidoglycan editing factor PgeF [Vitreoscilla sp.]